MRHLHLGALAVALLAPAACGGHDHPDTGEADEFFYDCENKPATVTVFATDEAFIEFINKEAGVGFKQDDSQAPRLLAPAPGSTLSAVTPPSVSFEVGASASRARPGRRTACLVAPRSRWSAVWRALSPVGTAYAHCPPVSGENFLFRITRDSDKQAIYTALLSVTSFTPTATVWSKALAGQAGQAVTLTLARAVYSKGDITNGPFVSSTPLRFTVGP
jgi:hypothetical protein